MAPFCLKGWAIKRSRIFNFNSFVWLSLNGKSKLYFYILNRVFCIITGAVKPEPYGIIYQVFRTVCINKPEQIVLDIIFSGVYDVATVDLTQQKFKLD